MTDSREVGKRIAAARGYAQMSALSFAEKIGMGYRTYIRTESGCRWPRMEELQRISEVTGVPTVFFEAGFDPLLDLAIERAEARLRELKKSRESA